MSRRADLLVAVLYVVWIGIWSVSILFNGAPDEGTHMFLVEYLYKFHAMPVAGHDPASPFVGLLSGDTYWPDTFWYHGLPYLHVLGATGLAMVLAPLLPHTAGYLAARAFNWLLGGVFIFCLISIVRRQGLSGRWPYLLAGAIALIPQVSFIFAYFNSDAFALVCATSALALLLRFLRQANRLNALQFGLACGLVLCAKVYYFPALVFFAGLLLASRLTNQKSVSAQQIMILVAGALLIAVPVLGLTYAQFGEVTGFKGQQAFVTLHKNDPGYGLCFILCRDSIVHAHALVIWMRDYAYSFFMTTGWMDIRLPKSFYWFLFGPAVLLMLVGSIALLARAVGRLRTDPGQSTWNAAIVVLFWGMVIGTTLFNLAGSQMLLPEPQGRYLFVVLPFAGLLIARIVVAYFSQPIAPRASWLPLAAVLLIVGVNIASLAVTARGAGAFPAIGVDARELGLKPSTQG